MTPNARKDVDQNAVLDAAARALDEHTRSFRGPRKPDEAYVAVVPAVGAIRVPAAGTVVVMRLSDWMRTQPRVARPPVVKQLKDGPVTDLVLKWLDGKARPDCYGPDVIRGPRGEVIETSCAAVARSGILDGLGYTEHGRLMPIGTVLKRLRWTQRYASTGPGMREHRWYRPAATDELSPFPPRPPVMRKSQQCD